METTEAPVRLRTARDLWTVLTTGSEKARLAVLQSVVEGPERPISLGLFEGEDFVDLLLRLVTGSTGALRQLHILCLMCYADEKTSRFFVEEFRDSKDSSVVIMLGKRLAIEKGAAFFRPFLWDEFSARALVAARICASDETLEVADRLKVAILLDREYDAPLIEEESLDEWMTALLGRHRLKVRRLAEKRGREVLLFWSRWDKLPSEEQKWLLDLTAALDVSVLESQVRTCLSGEFVTSHLVKHALDCRVDLPPSLLKHEDPAVRAAAISSGLADDDLEPHLTHDADVAEAMAATARCTPERLLEMLSDDRWQIRAAATEALVGRGTSSVPALRELAAGKAQATRVAAVQALHRLGDGLWLESLFPVSV